MFGLMEFTPDLLIHVPAIDAQHKELLHRLNTLVALGAKSANNDETERTLDFLGSYVVKHFFDEEAFQLKCGYPKRIWHREQHLQFIDKFKTYKADYLKKGASQEFTAQIRRSIIDWVVQHVRVADADIGKYVNTEMRKKECVIN